MTSEIKTPLQWATDYINAGISVIPLRIDGTKAPLSPWNEYRGRFADSAELDRLFGRPAGIGIVCGVQSGGLEVLDFDERADETFTAWAKQIPADLFEKLCIVETGGLGYHVIYRCHTIGRNTKIAMSEAGGVLIESRGEGGYVVGVGSPPEVHLSKHPYTLIMGPPLSAVETITPDERKRMWCAAASLDERSEPFVEYLAKKPSEVRPVSIADGSTPWSDFDARANWAEILEPAGWHSTDGIHWVRPGKDFGTSAKVVAAKDGSPVLVVFSTSAGELAPAGVGHRTWGKFSAFATLYHGGDRSAAAKAVIALGFGRAVQ